MNGRQKFNRGFNVNNTRSAVVVPDNVLFECGSALEQMRLIADDLGIEVEPTE